jgi:hypothetical protein
VTAAATGSGRGRSATNTIYAAIIITGRYMCVGLTGPYPRAPGSVGNTTALQNDSSGAVVTVAVVAGLTPAGHGASELGRCAVKGCSIDDSELEDDFLSQNDSESALGVRIASFSLIRKLTTEEWMTRMKSGLCHWQYHDGRVEGAKAGPGST